MTCPRCHFQLEKSAPECPKCGVRLLRSVSGILKTSAVMIAAGDEQGFYPSVRDVPEPLRSQLLESTASPNSGTIVIADRAGKEQLTRMMARREPVRDCRTESTTPQEAPEEAPAPQARRIHWIGWAGLLLFIVLVAVIALLFGLHW